MVIEERKFSLFNASGRNNKFWNISLYDNGDVVVHFGSQGQSGQQKTHYSMGRSFFEKKIRDKTSPSHHGGPYIENKVLEAVQTGPSTTKVSNYELKDKAVRDIVKNNTNPELTKLIHYFAEVNAHNIMEASGGKITYDTSSGTFRTTQGVVTLHQVQEARNLLDNIDKYAGRSDFRQLIDAKGVGLESRQLFEYINLYLSLIPQAGLVRQMDLTAMFSVAAGLRKQNDILDGLESSYASVIASSNKDNGKKSVEPEKALFKVDLSPAEDREFQRVKTLYNRTKGSHWDVQDYDVKKVWMLTIHHMKDAFESRGKAVGNIKELWHGTACCNLLSILKAGYLLPRQIATSVHITGAMFGPGTYFSDQSTKAIRYATGAWGGSGARERKFMLLNHVAMGREYVPRNSFSGKPPAGFDSTFAKAGFSGVQNNEMIVYALHQINPLRLIEFTIGGK
jgi:poly [ADP-ribose] polymerase